MKRKKFLSRLFRREININEQDYFSIVHGELLYRISELKERKCSCMECKVSLTKYEKALEDVKQINTS